MEKQQVSSGCPAFEVKPLADDVVNLREQVSNVRKHCDDLSREARLEVPLLLSTYEARTGAISYLKAT